MRHRPSDVLNLPAGREPAAAPAVIVSASLQKQSIGQSISDGVITAKIKALLVAEPVTESYDIRVETFQGIVQLSGFVETMVVRGVALQFARDVEGVQQVTDSLDVRNV